MIHILSGSTHSLDLASEGVPTVIPEANAQSLEVFGHTLSTALDTSSVRALEQVTVSTVELKPRCFEKRIGQE